MVSTERIVFWALLIFIFSGIVRNCYSEPKNTDDQQTNIIIQQALRYFEEGYIDKAEHLALKRLDDEKTLSVYEKFLIYKLLAFCAIASDDEESGVRYFVLALRQNPGLSPDPLTWSPKVRTVFAKAQTQFVQKVTMEKKQEYALDAQFSRRASLKSLYFPGSGQVLKGHNFRGYTLGILFWSALAGTIYSQTELPALRDNYHNAGSSEDARRFWLEYRDGQYLVNITGIACLTIYGYSFFDALWAKPAIDLKDGQK